MNTVTTAADMTLTIAGMVAPGMVFELFNNTCIVVYAEPNDFGMIIVRFLTDSSTNTEVSVMVVPADTMFHIHTQ